VPNARGDLGIIVHASNINGNHRPAAAFAIVDDFTTAPPPFSFSAVANSNARPADNVGAITTRLVPLNRPSNFGSRARTSSGKTLIA
jgi:hypothetical protein